MSRLWVSVLAPAILLAGCQNQEVRRSYEEHRTCYITGLMGQSSLAPSGDAASLEAIRAETRDMLRITMDEGERLGMTSKQVSDDLSSTLRAETELELKTTEGVPDRMRARIKARRAECRRLLARGR